jgi:1-aminocyclopropane-1-carboxylate deaminase/D-cysteine desulfhydrase-like pyridoxal-dependent ACC family enzyme
LLGACIHWIQPSERVDKLGELPDQLRKDGRKPYVIPVGGSNGVGATGYMLAMIELVEQLDGINRRVDHVVFASSSGGTQAGMVVGAKVTGFNGKLHGVSIDKDGRDGVPYEQELAEIANDAAEYINFDAKLTANDFNVVYEYLGGGYGVVSDLEREAIRLIGSREGIVLDPVYTGRSMGALIDLIRKKAFRSGETVLFWHTGGAPALFAYAKDLI